jgi:SAM-dependent methyltransferase
MTNNKEKHEYFSGVRLDSISLLPKINFTKVLEIGGGDFDTLTYVKRAFNVEEAWGIDVRQIDNKDINLVIGSVEDFSIQKMIPDDEFDLIIANDVIEHLVDTEGFMKFAHRKLTKNGLLLISVPNIRNIKAFWYIFFKGVFPRGDAGLFDKTHLRWFTRKDIIQQVDKQFECTRHRYGGRYIRGWNSRLKIFELIALHNIFLCKKK